MTGTLCTFFFTFFFIGFPEGGPRADGGTFLIVYFKVLVFPHTLGDFFLAKSPVFGEAKHPTGFEDALQNFILVL